MLKPDAMVTQFSQVSKISCVVGVKKNWFTGY